jgi:hypothetical protein
MAKGQKGTTEARTNYLGITSTCKQPHPTYSLQNLNEVMDFCRGIAQISRLMSIELSTITSLIEKHVLFHGVIL